MGPVYTNFRGCASGEVSSHCALECRNQLAARHGLREEAWVHIAVVIPALDEEASIGSVVENFRAELLRLGHRASVVVGDNGSTDETAARAKEAGAHVAFAARRGYGSACLAAMGALPADTDIVVFADGDGADDPQDCAALLAPLLASCADLVIGSRAEGMRLALVERGALSVPQRFGNMLSSTLLGLRYGGHFTDLGPFRAIACRALLALEMDDRDFGWTVQMQARALRAGLRVVEVPVHYRRRRAGRSKVSGSVKGSVLAGVIILRTLAKEVGRPARK
jgi:glycosyltransferase involved in cell wall biosynthesis